MRALALFLLATGLGFGLLGCPRGADRATSGGVAAPPTPKAPAPQRSAGDAGASLWDGTAIDRAVEAALAEGGKLPGCVVVVGTHDRVLYRHAYGYRSVDPDQEAMTLDTVFDLASLTKPLATALSLIALEERGVLSLDDPAAKYVPAFAAKGKESITLRQLMLHVAGLPAVTARSDYSRGIGEAVLRIGTIAPTVAPGVRFRYSDVGYVLLGEIVARASGKSLDAFARETFYEPLEMRDTTFLPSMALRPRIAPTERRDGVMLRGEVHDPISATLGGVAGNAGLFSTGDDLAKLAQMLLGRGTRAGKKVLAESSVDRMMTVFDVPAGLRAPGWDVRSSLSLNRSERWSHRAIGHGGYTGTALWIDPTRDLFVVFLSNRVHPDGKGAITPLVARIGTIAVDASDAAEGRLPPLPECEGTAGAAPAVTTSVMTGIDVLAAEQFRRLAGKRIALLSNGAARARDGRTTFKVLKDALGPRLTLVFTPEHGFGADAEGKIADGTLDGVQAKSLYGERLSPEDEVLSVFDTLVVDLPDVGARFFTYGATLHRVLRVLSTKGKSVLVLDRPNPYGGVQVDGPTEVPSGAFVQHHPIPILHGLTLGELAWLLDADEHLGTKLDVVTVRGWRRGSWFDETGLTWTPPSPNLPSFQSALAYPAAALVEGTNVSVGRGTKEPFEVIGAPWMNPVAIIRSLATMAVAGVAFEATRFTPTSSRYASQDIPAIRMKIVDRTVYRPVRTGLAIAAALRAAHPTDWDAAALDGMIGAKLAAAVREGQPIGALEASYRSDAAAFAAKRNKHLLYGVCPSGDAGVGPGAVGTDAGASRSATTWTP
jgi:uncharacterized protein YbbC (DUF1343 family)